MVKKVIYIACHKFYKMPKNKLYQPIWVGYNLKKDSLNLPKGWIGDNTGKNISYKNPYFNELTALYWIWKNSSADIIGLVHYRRYFSLDGKKGFDHILTNKQLEQLISKSPIIVPTKRKYYIETNYSHYIHAHHPTPINKIKTLMTPKYQKSYDKIMGKTSQHLFNMMIMTKKELDKYASWMFKLLFKLEKKIDISNYNNYERRLFGFIGERLLDIYLDANQKKFIEVPFVFEEKQNWIKKGGSFLLRKFTGGKNGK